MDSPSRSHLQTELRLAESMALDTMTTGQIVALLAEQDAVAVAAVAREASNVTAAVEMVVDRLGAGGRLIYFGAGTSGRLGVVDASECPPTFRTEPWQVLGVIAGGDDAMFRAKEGAEDSLTDGAAQVDARDVGPSDVVMGIAAGGTTPFVHGALRRAIERGAKTIFLSCVESVPGEPPVDVVIRPITGPEVLTGSTRLKAGTATKLVLNQITTTAMVRLGKCYENLMVDVRATNSKLLDRAVRIVQVLSGVGRGQAEAVLREAGGQVKLAVLMQRRGLDRAPAEANLARSAGNLRLALQSE